MDLSTTPTSPLSLLGGPTLVALYTAVIVRPHADCGLQAIARRSFFSSAERYAEQARKAYDRLSSVELDKIYNKLLEKMLLEISKSIKELGQSNPQMDPTTMMMMMRMMSDQQNKDQPK